MKRWSWLLAIALSVSTMVIVGCSGDDDADTTPTTTTTVVTNVVGGVRHTNVVVVTNAPATSTHPPITTPTPSITSLVLFDGSQGIAGGASFEIISDPTPQAGSVTISASWTAIDLIARGAPIDIPLEFRVNEGVPGAGAFVNSGHPSPFSGGVDMPRSLGCKVNVINNISDSMATVHLRVVWTAN